MVLGIPALGSYLWGVGQGHLFFRPPLVIKLIERRLTSSIKVPIAWIWILHTVSWINANKPIFGQVKRDGITWRLGPSGSPGWRSWVARQWRLRGVLWKIYRLLRGRMRELEKQWARRVSPNTRDQYLLVYSSTGRVLLHFRIKLVTPSWIESGRRVHGTTGQTGQPVRAKTPFCTLLY